MIFSDVFWDPILNAKFEPKFKIAAEQITNKPGMQVNLHTLCNMGEKQV